MRCQNRLGGVRDYVHITRGYVEYKRETNMSESEKGKRAMISLKCDSRWCAVICWHILDETSSVAVRGGSCSRRTSVMLCMCWVMHVCEVVCAGIRVYI